MAVQISGNDITVPRDGSFTRNVTIGGTLTYEDVTNIDSVGLVTARTGIEIGARPGVAASISVDGNMIISGISTFGDDVKINVDSKKILLGAGADLEVFHNGTNSHLRTQTGNLIIDNNSGGTVNIRPKIGEEGVVCTTDGSTALYHDGTKKFETSSTGASVSGNLDLSTDNYKLRLGGGNDIQLYTDGSHSYLNNENGNWYIHGSTGSNSQEILIRPKQAENSIRAIADGAVELYHDNVKSFETITHGVQVTDDDSSVQINMVNSVGTVGYLYGTGANAFGLLDGQGEYLVKGIKDGAVELYHDGTKQCETAADGLAFPSGKGINFNATADASETGVTAGSETFDDYEEGTFTPSIYYQNSSGLTIGTNSASGKYTKIGRVCYIIGYINWSVSGSPANDNVAILGLPFSTDPGKIAAGGTRLVGNISLEGTSNESTTHQLEPYGNTGANIITDDEKGNKANELGGNSNMLSLIHI